MNYSNLTALNISEDKSFDSTGKGKTTKRGATRQFGWTTHVLQPSVTSTQELQAAGLVGTSFEDGVTDTEFAILVQYVGREPSSTNSQAVTMVETKTGWWRILFTHFGSGIDRTTIPIECSLDLKGLADWKPLHLYASDLGTAECLYERIGALYQSAKADSHV